MRQSVRVSPSARAAASLLIVAAALLVCPAAFAADRALEDARALFGGSAMHARGHGGAGVDPRAGTRVLRALRAALPRLSASERAEAERLLARPTNEGSPYEPGWGSGLSKRRCDAHVCIHWVEAGPDAPPPADTDGSGAPDWVETTLAVFGQVWVREIDELGYRPPLSDLGSIENGGDGRLDVYLADVGAQGYFGWCTSDDPGLFATRRVSAYCVIDEDYANPAFKLAPQAALKATAAHEFFHASQFSYDWLEDLWLMEGTAAWMEDEVFDGVNDNLRYLRSDSPVVQPDVPLDRGRGGYEYGAWIFWRYVSERFGAGFVRRIWNQAEPRASGNRYSLAATRSAVRGRGRSFRGLFAGFGVANVIPKLAYLEGGSYPDRGAGALAVTSGVSPRTVRLRRLSNRAVGLRPAGPGTALRIEVAASSPRNAAVTVIVRRSSGATSTRRIRLDRSGQGHTVVPFGLGEVRRVDLVFTNADTRLTCWRGTSASCGGVAKGKPLRVTYAAQVLR